MNPAGEWRLSPAYDLVHSSGPGGRAYEMTVAGEGREPKREHILKLANQFGITGKDVTLDHRRGVNAAVEKWPRWADEAGVTKKTYCGKLQRECCTI